MLIENNVLYNYQNCIDIPGDAKYWFETGGVRDVVIRNNIFIHHNAFQAVSAIKIKPDFDCPVSDYHRNILIENNSFFGNNPRLLDAACTDGLIFEETLIPCRLLTKPAWRSIASESKTAVNFRYRKLLTDRKGGIS